MKRLKDQKQALLALTIEAVGRRGLSEFSLRHLASEAGLSTTAIFQNFSGKADLIAGALAVAIEFDQAFHQRLFDQISGLLSNHVNFADFLARYLLMRPSQPQAQFASDILVNLDDYPQCHDLLRQWQSDREQFWARMLAPLNPRLGVARLVSEFVLMEEHYVYALQGECTYELLLAETCRALTDAAFHEGASGATGSDVSLRLGTQPWSLREADEESDTPIKEQLLNEAIGIIEHSGLEALNQRRIAKNAGVSTSAIAYYFKDMKSFRNRAIWRALIHGVPSQLDPEQSSITQPADLNQWLEALNAMLEVRSDERPSGFYIGFARLTAQACLLARHDPSLRPLIAYLRELEGWGTYRVSRNVPVLTHLIGRDHAAAFGVWIKSEALLRRVNLASPGNGKERLEFAAAQIFPER